jgi:hypothetical protein
LFFSLSLKQASKGHLILPALEDAGIIEMAGYREDGEG